MRKNGARTALLAATVTVLLAASLPSHAFHFYRSTDGGCAPADGTVSDDPPETIQRVTVTVPLGHNVFGVGLVGSGSSVHTLLKPHEVRISAGESITWTWNSAHCHSVTASDQVAGEPVFDSGFLYPITPPESARVLPGVFEYPLLDDTPTLGYTHTFTTPGRFNYFCVHHASIGMNGVVIVDP